MLPLHFLGEYFVDRMIHQLVITKDTFAKPYTIDHKCLIAT